MAKTLCNFSFTILKHCTLSCAEIPRSNLCNNLSFLQRKHYGVIRRRPIGVKYPNKPRTFDEYDTQAKTTSAPEDTFDNKGWDDVIDSPGDNQNTENNSEQKPISIIKDESAKHKNSLELINFQLYEKVKRTYRQHLENGKSAKKRYDSNTFVVEGWRLCAEALKAGLEPKAIFYSRSGTLTQMGRILNQSPKELAEFLNMYPLIKTPYEVLQMWSSLVTSPGIAAAFSISEANDLTKSLLSKPEFPIYVILDQIRDPSNLGSLIRTLVAAGVQKIILMKGCCDLWDHKVLRGSCGGHFKMSFVTKAKWEMVTSYLPQNPKVFVAESEESQTKSLYAPSDSLIDHSYEESQNQTSYYIDELGEKVYVNESYADPIHLEKFQDLKIPSRVYDDVKFVTDETEPVPIALIIGGETGLSAEAKKYVVESYGSQLSIPLVNNIESLNSSIAAAIITYEITRQFRSIQLHQQSKKDFV